MQPSKTEYGENIDDSYGSIGFRLEAIISSQTEEKNRYANLEILTNVSRDNWRAWWNKRHISTPSGSLIQAAALLWPQYAFWLATGMTDLSNGHTLVSGYGYTKAFPDYVDDCDVDVMALTISYFDMKKELIKLQYGPSTPVTKPEDHKPREILDIKRNALESMRVARQQRIALQPFNHKVSEPMSTISDLDKKHSKKKTK